jgi:hypothetical protein
MQANTSRHDQTKFQESFQKFDPAKRSRVPEVRSRSEFNVDLVKAESFNADRVLKIPSVNGVTKRAPPPPPSS